MPLDGSGLWQLANQLLDVVTGAYQELANIDPPETRYVTAAPVPTWWPNTLVVAHQVTEYRQPGEARGQEWVARSTMFPKTATFQIFVFRSLEDHLQGQGFQLSAGPSPSRAQTDAELIFRDRWILARAVILGVKAGKIGRDYSTALSVGMVQALEPESAIGGSVQEVHVEEN